MCLKLKEAAQTPEMRTVIRYVMKMSAQNRQEHNNVQSRAEHDYFSLTEFSVPAPSMHRIHTRASWTPRMAAKSPRTPSSYSCGSTTTLDTPIGNTELPTTMNDASLISFSTIKDCRFDCQHASRALRPPQTGGGRGGDTGGTEVTGPADGYVLHA